jgi:hypothetical protein
LEFRFNFALIAFRVPPGLDTGIDTLTKGLRDDAAPHAPPNGGGRGSREEAGDKWFVRMPLRPCLAFGARSKLEGEITTMQWVPSLARVLEREQQMALSNCALAGLWREDVSA